MQQFNIAEAKSHFSILIKLAMMGEDIVIARNNKPLLRLVPVETVRKERKPGSAKAQILYVAPDVNDLPSDFKESM